MTCDRGDVNSRNQFSSDDDFSKHDIDNLDCNECWDGYPRQCKCGGLIHQEFLDEDWDSVYFRYRCNKCWDDYEEPT